MARRVLDNTVKPGTLIFQGSRLFMCCFILHTPVIRPSKYPKVVFENSFPPDALRNPPKASPLRAKHTLESDARDFQDFMHADNIRIAESP